MVKKRNHTRPRRPSSPSKRHAGSPRAPMPHAVAAMRSGESPAADPADPLAEAIRTVFADQLRTTTSERSTHPGGTPARREDVGRAPVGVAERPDSVPGGRLSGCSAAFAEMPQALAVTYWGEASGEDVPIRVSGVHQGSASHAREQFTRTSTIAGLPSGTGRFAATIRINGVSAGEWDVRAARADRPAARDRLQRAVLRSRPSQLAYGPAVRVWSWPVLVLAGAMLAIVVQALLLARSGANVGAGVAVSIASCVAGYLGAKAWYLVLKRKHPRVFFSTGACIQGFLLAAAATLAIGGAMTGIGAAALLDATTPGLFLGMAVGRPGCFLTGCCAGRPTASRWGVWSSDRAVAVRRVPVQLWEAGAALVIGAATLTVALITDVAVPGALFVGAVAAYTGVRQLLFPFRADPHTPTGRHLTIAACAVVIAAVVLTWF